MTYEEAIKYFKDHIQSYCVTGVCKEAEELAIEALQKQVPMKPSEVKKLPWKYKCPVCSMHLITKASNICICGQRIDWSDKE